MTEHELMALRARCLAAHTYGRKIANAAGYADALEAECGPVPPTSGMVQHSPAHLMALVDKVMKVRSGEESASSAKSESKPKGKKKAAKAKASKSEAHEDDAMAADLPSYSSSSSSEQSSSDEVSASDSASHNTDDA